MAPRKDAIDKKTIAKIEKLAETKKDAKVDMKPVRAAVEKLRDAGRAFEKAYGSLGRASTTTLLGREELQALNQLLITSERTLGEARG